MNLLSDCITYIRRIIKSPSNAQITDNLIIDYINRFWVMDVDARMQLFDLKTTYQFQTVPGVDRYNMPLYSIQPTPPITGIGPIASYPVYQGFLDPCYINGVLVQLSTQRDSFYQIWPNWVQNLTTVAQGDGRAASTPYSIQIPLLGTPASPLNPPIQGLLRGHVDISGIMAVQPNPFQDPLMGTSLASVPVTSVYPAVYFTSIDANGNSLVISDSGQFLTGQPNYGLLMTPGNAPLGNTGFSTYNTSTNTINYLSGAASVTFPAIVPSGANINAQVYYFQAGLPRGILFYNNTLTFRAPPDRQYLVQLTAYLTPAAFLATSQALPFGYMTEYIARGAARKILSDTGDIEQFQFYEPLFQEQEQLVWKRSQRQFTATRTQNIYSQGNLMGINQPGTTGLGGNSF